MLSAISYSDRHSIKAASLHRDLSLTDQLPFVAKTADMSALTSVPCLKFLGLATAFNKHILSQQMGPVNLRQMHISAWMRA